ncbi:MAG: hypothetical protein HFF37_02875 [Coprobacillus sp.]|nr:hypothetical protein [Coprobacillus sp.]
MKKKTVVASTLTISTLTAGLTLVNQFSKKVLYRESLDCQNQEDWYSELGGEKIKIKNHKNLYLQGYLFEEENAHRTIIGLHGLGKSASSLKDTFSFLKEIFPQSHILLYDANAHGLSDGYIKGFGYKDVLDLMFFNMYVLRKYGENHRVIMYGQGVGANTILNTSGLGKLKNVDLILSEGAYSQAYQYLGYLCQKETKIASQVCRPIIRQMIKSEVKRDIKKMNTVSLVKKNTIPTVFIHAKDDQDVPFKMVFPLYNHNQSNKLLFPIKQNFLYQLKGLEDDYLKSLYEFIEEVL